MSVPEITGAVTLHDGWVKILKLTMRTASGATLEREVEHHGPAVAVLPFDAERRTAILVSQLRPAAFHAGGPPQMLEVIAGMLDEDDPAACARREAHEEAGLRLGDLTPLGSLWSSPGVSTERVHLFLAPYGETDRVAAGGGLAGEQEDITVVEMPLHELRGLAERGALLDLKTLALVQALCLRRPDLWA